MADGNYKNERKKPVLMALAGNPNSGKTTVFNAITGARQHVGNYPGVTVERKEGEAKIGGRPIHVIDLPGTYSLSAYSPDELVARNTLLTERPDVVVHVVDAGNLERNLYLTTQLMAMKTPLVLAFNMMDEVEKSGVKIDLPQLEKLLGVPIVPTVGSRAEGIEALLAKAVEVADTGAIPRVDVRFGGELDLAIDRVQAAVVGSEPAGAYDARWLSIKLLEADPEVSAWFEKSGDEKALEEARSAGKRVSGLMGEDPSILLADARYGFVHGAVAETVTLAVETRRTLTDKVDMVVADRALGLPIFLFLMWLTFEVTFRLGAPMADLIDRGFGGLGELVGAALPPGLLSSLIVDGVIAGVGGVLVFLPNIILLFMMVSIMEDSGYMARAAFIVDRVMHVFGLHGKSFIPLFLGFGCNVPAIMSARILENDRDRKATIMVAPFVSCSARLPVYVLFAGAFFPAAKAGRVIFSLYILGIAIALVMAKLLRAYVVKGPPTPFVMELPPYRMPTAKSVLIHMWERAWMYIKKAGTIIMAVSIIVWFMSNFPRPQEPAPGPDTELVSPDVSETYAGRLGGAIAPALKPIGLDDWKVGVALFAGFVAKEVVVSTMGTIYSLEEASEEGPDLRRALRADGFFTPLRAYVLMVFVLLYTPCLATLAVAWRELGSVKWAVMMVAISFTTAYAAALAVYWGGRFLGLQ